MNTREFDLVLLGPTGYTGQLCTEYIMKTIPANFRWALAGRSASKIYSLFQNLKSIDPKRTEPEIINVQLKKEDLNALAKRTRLILNCVGPFHLYSSPVVEACAQNKTHYVDVTGETPWIKDMIDQNHEVAKSNGAIIIPSVGLESAIPDILAWNTIDFLRGKVAVGPAQTVSSVHELKTSGASGGTLATVLSYLENAKISDLAKFSNPFILAAAPSPRNFYRKPLTEKLLGVRSVSDLGTLTASPSAIADESIANRSSTLMPSIYGPAFTYKHYVHVRNTFTGILFHYAFMAVISFLLLAPVRWLVKKSIYGPGQGPTKEETANDRVEYRVSVTADQEGTNKKPKRVLGSISYNGGMYQLTAATVSEAARVILENEDEIRKEFQGGLLTPATLGHKYVQALEKSGFKFDAKLVDA